MAELIITSKKNRNKKLRLPRKEIVLGRNEECGIRLESEEIGGRHCSLTPTSNGWLLKDLGSKAGTFVNSERIRRESVLKSGDRLKIGLVEFQFRDSRTVSRDSEQQKGTATDDDIANWLTDETEKEEQSAPTNASDETVSESKKFESIAEEAADIIRRHQESTT